MMSKKEKEITTISLSILVSTMNFYQTFDGTLQRIHQGIHILTGIISAKAYTNRTLHFILWNTERKEGSA